MLFGVDRPSSLVEPVACSSGIRVPCYVAEMSIELDVKRKDVRPLQLEHMSGIISGTALSIDPKVGIFDTSSPTHIISKTIVHGSFGY